METTAAAKKRQNSKREMITGSLDCQNSPFCHVKVCYDNISQASPPIDYPTKIVVHALWFLRVWSLRASTRFLKKIRVCQYPFVPIFKGIFQSQYSHFQIIYCKGMVSKSKYWISKNNKGNEYSKTPKNP